MALYSAQLLQYQGSGTSPTVTVPSGETWVIRDIEALMHTSVAGDSIVLELNGVRYWSYVMVGGLQYEHAQWTGRMVLPAATTMYVITTGTIGVWISGYQLSN